MNIFWHVLPDILFGILLLAIVIAIVLSFAILTWACRNGLKLFKVDDKAVSPASVQAYALLCGAVIGGIWVAFIAVSSGSISLQRAQLEQTKAKIEPNVEIELTAVPLSAANESTPIVFTARLTNPSQKGITLLFGQQPTLSIALVKLDKPDKKAKAGDSEKITGIDSEEIICDSANQCRISKRKELYISAGGKESVTFFHPGLKYGTYLVQLSIIVSERLENQEATGGEKRLKTQSIYLHSQYTP